MSSISAGRKRDNIKWILLRNYRIIKGSPSMVSSEEGVRFTSANKAFTLQGVLMGIPAHTVSPCLKGFVLFMMSFSTLVLFSL